MAGGKRCFDGLNGAFLIVAQVEVGEAFLLQPGFGGALVARQHIQQAGRGVEVHQWPGEVGRVADVAEPGAALFGQLLQVGPAVAGIDEWDFEVAALGVGPAGGKAFELPGGLGDRQLPVAARVAFCLRDFAGNIGVFALGFDHGDGCQAGEQHIIGGFIAERRPFGDCAVFAFFRAAAFGVGDFLSVGLPAGFDQLLVDQNAGEFFIEAELLAGGMGALADLLRRFLAGFELALQGLQAVLEFLFDAIQRGCLFFGQTLIGAGFGVHLTG